MITYHAIRYSDKAIVSVYDNGFVKSFPNDNIGWGYCGQGPNTLARYILEDYCRRTGRTYDLINIHDLVFDIIARIYGDEFVLPGEVLDRYTKEVNHA